MKEYATKYYCKTCGSYKWIPERPLQAKRTISTGCDNCARIRTHKAVGVIG